jgi:2-polyprenyl-3-methyl-5-hydroxy-6-metoxy-1,4-benzoquinol methylase
MVDERLTLEAATAPTLIACEHRHRYRFAASVLAGARVLDLCCGSGYGARVLAETAGAVHGVDIDATTIDTAAATISGPVPITFEAADALDFVRRADVSERFDAIVCFEGLEHLPELDRILERLRELAEGGMKMVLSVPNSEGLGEDNEFHLTDFSYEEALERIGSFPGATVLTQYLAEGSVITMTEPGGGEVDAHAVLDERDEPEYANHYIVCVGEALSAALPDGLMQLEAAPLANRYMRNLERANKVLWRTNQRLGRSHLGKADSAAGALVAKYEAAAAALTDAQTRLEDLEREHQAWIARCLGAEAREEALRDQLRATQVRLSTMLANGLRKAVRRERRLGDQRSLRP